jgi:uncharacterized SAM-binding protein YcdF (DUF218 family)
LVTPFRSRTLRWLAAVALLAGILVLTRPLWLTALGRFLVESQEPFSAEMVVVLAGDDTGHRILKGAELVRQGYAPKVLVSGPECCYGNHESDLAIPFAVQQGCSQEWFIPLPHSARSTLEEARLVLRELESRHVRRFLLVTSDFHTARAARVYRRLAPRGSFRVVAASSPDFSAGGWWHSREGRKQFLIEWIKTVAYWFGI